MKQLLTTLTIIATFVGPAAAQGDANRSRTEQDRTSTIRNEHTGTKAQPTSPSGSKAGSRSSGEMMQDTDSVLPPKTAK
jgi:hypothetical protein